MRTVLLLLLTSLIAARCPEPSWVVDDDRIFAIVSREGQPVKHAMVQLASPDQRYNATTDENGRFLIPAVAVGKYTLVVKGWGEALLEVRGWKRGAINRPVLLLSSTNKMSSAHTSSKLISNHSCGPTIEPEAAPPVYNLTRQRRGFGSVGL